MPGGPPRSAGSAGSAMTPEDPPMTPEALRDAFLRVRRQTDELAAPLTGEDQTAQSLPEASPVKWHLAHTSWFFEAFVLTKAGTGYAPAASDYGELFGAGAANGGGRRHPRRERGLLTRPTAAEVGGYRRRVDEAVLSSFEAGISAETAAAALLGIHHEQRHQEFLLADLKHLFWKNPRQPAYRPSGDAGVFGPPAPTPPLRFVSFAGGELAFGHGGGSFAFAGETPRHSRLLPPFQLASRLVTNREYLEFVEEGGYREASLWLADGWEARRRHGWEAPLYWKRAGGGFEEFTLGGLAPLAPESPVSHVSFFEADAFARWRESRLPTEFEWEAAAAGRPVRGAFLESGLLHPSPAEGGPIGGRAASPAQLFGDLWEWTASAGLPYPGFRSVLRSPAAAAAAPDGRFLFGRMVLRGGSCLTPAGGFRATCRNFLRPEARWQASGIRLARGG